LLFTFATDLRCSFALLLGQVFNSRFEDNHAAFHGGGVAAEVTPFCLLPCAMRLAPAQPALLSLSLSRCVAVAQAIIGGIVNHKFVDCVFARNTAARGGG
jgi:hypothetical protein